MEAYHEKTSMTRSPVLIHPIMDIGRYLCKPLSVVLMKLVGVILRLRDQWIAAEKKASSCNSKAKISIYNVIDASYFKLISQCASAQKAWKTLDNMFENTTSFKQTKLDMLKSIYDYAEVYHKKLSS